MKLVDLGLHEVFTCHLISRANNIVLRFRVNTRPVSHDDWYHLAHCVLLKSTDLLLLPDFRIYFLRCESNLLIDDFALSCNSSHFRWQLIIYSRIVFCVWPQ